MKKVVYIAIVLLLALSVSLFVKANITRSFFDSNVEALADGESSSFCYSGGRGASHCTIKGGIEILGCGFSIDCEVTCRDGYYACCGIGCTCVAE